MRLAGEVPRPLVGLLVAATVAAAPAHAEPLALEGPLPFTAVELESALALRLDLASLPLSIVVRGAATWAEVAYGPRLRRIELGDVAGVAAARRVALLVTDLVAEERTLGEGPEPTPPHHAPIPAPVVEPVEPPSRLDVGLAAWGALGSELDRVRVGLAAEASVSVVAPLRAWASVGVAWSPDTGRGGADVELTGLPLRAGLALRADAVEVRAHAALTPWWVAAEDAATERRTTRTDVVASAGAAILYRIHTAPELRLGGGAELSFDPRAYLGDGARVAATDRVLVWLAASVAWELVR